VRERLPHHVARGVERQAGAQGARNREPLGAVLAEVERVMLFEALRQSDGDEEDAARRLNLPTDEFKQRLQGLE